MTKKQLLEVINSGEKTYLYFFAPWCGACKRMSKRVESCKVPLIKVDGSKNEDILDAFKIEYYPTIVEIRGLTKRTYEGTEEVRNLLS